MSRFYELSALASIGSLNLKRENFEENEKKAAEELNRRRNLTELDLKVDSFLKTSERVLQTLDDNWRSIVIKNLKKYASKLTVDGFLQFIEYYTKQIQNAPDPDLNPYFYYQEWIKLQDPEDQMFHPNDSNNALPVVERINLGIFKEAYTFDKVGDVLKWAWESLKFRDNIINYKLKETFRWLQEEWTSWDENLWWNQMTELDIDWEKFTVPKDFLEWYIEKKEQYTSLLWFSFVDQFLWSYWYIQISWFTREILEDKFNLWRINRFNGLKNDIETWQPWLKNSFKIFVWTNHFLKVNGITDPEEREKWIKNFEERLVRKNEAEREYSTFSQSRLDTVYRQLENYTLQDLTAAIILTSENSDARYLNNLMSLFISAKTLFKVDLWSDWDCESTSAFLLKLRDYPDFFKNIPNAQEVYDKLDQLIAEHPVSVNESGPKVEFLDFKEVEKQIVWYYKDPVAYRRSQERWHRDFVWVRRDRSVYPSISSETPIERSFISNSANQSSKLNWEIAKWLDMSWKTLDQQREIEERLMHLIPKDKIHVVVNDLLSNPVIRRNFVEELNMSEEMLDDEVLFDRIVNYETWDQQFETIKERFFWKLRDNKWDVIVGFAWELSDFLKEQIGVSALNVRKDFLEDIFWFSITPVELPWQKDDVFYFRDQYHPETVYEYRPKTWEIFAQESISLKDGEIFFNWGQTDQKRLIYTLKKYSEYLDWVDVLGILPIWWDRPDSFESLQDKVSRNIQRYMRVDIWFTEVEWIHERNDSERMKNEIVDRAREILWITQDQLTESQDGPYYELLLSVINSVQDISRENLSEVRFFFEQFSEIMYDIRNGVSVNEGLIKNPLLKFVVEKTKNLENNGQNFVLDVKTKKNWREVDLAFWSILRELMYIDVDWKEKLSIGSIAFLNNAREWSPWHEKFVQDITKRYEELSHPMLALRNQELSSLDEWRDNAVQWVIRETWSEVADLWHFVRADQKLDREMDKAFELEFDVSVKIPDNPQNDIA